MAVIDATGALELVGVPFRPQGRGRDGLDCVGLCLTAYRMSGERVRADYRLRGNFRQEIEEFLASHFRKICTSAWRPGDLMLMQLSHDQFHLGIRTEQGFVHADARLRRIVETPGEPDWPLVGIYRRRQKGNG